MEAFRHKGGGAGPKAYTHKNQNAFKTIHID